MIIKYREEGHDYLASGELDWYLRQGEAAEVTSADDPAVTVAALIQVWETDLEGANYHSMTSIPENLVETLKKHGVAEPAIKAILFDIVTTGGWI